MTDADFALSFFLRFCIIRMLQAGVSFGKGQHGNRHLVWSLSSATGLLIAERSNKQYMKF